MKFQTAISVALLAISAGLAGCASQNQVPPPTTVVVEQPRSQSQSPLSAPTYDYTQTPETNSLISRDRARKFVQEFMDLYAGPNKAATTFAIRVDPGPNGNSAASSPYLGDQVTIAELVRDFGRPLREGGMTLLNENGAGSTRPEIVLNIYASYRQITIKDFDGSYLSKYVPDVEVTAVRTADGTVVGQASTTDVIGDKSDAWVRVQRVGMSEIMRATALDLLEDMAGRKLIDEFRSAAAGSGGSSDVSVTSPSANSTSASGDKDLPAWCWALIPDDKLKTQVHNLPAEQKTALRAKCEEYRAWQFALLPENQTRDNPGKYDSTPKVVTPFFASQTEVH